MGCVNEKRFKRLTGVSREVFGRMVAAVQKNQRHGFKPAPGYRRSRLCCHDQVLLALMYWREYRTLEHIGFTYGISEAQASRIVRRVEDLLMHSGQFRLPGKKALREGGMEITAVIVDATESEIEKPKKTGGAAGREKSGVAL